MGSAPLDSTNQEAGDQSHAPHIRFPTNNEERRVHDTESSPNEMLDANIIEKSAEDSANLTLQMSEVKAKHLTLLVDENMTTFIVSKGHWETNKPLRTNKEEWVSSQQQRETLSSVPAFGTGNIIYGSDQRMYRIHKGFSGPTGPQGRRVRLFDFELYLRCALIQRNCALIQRNCFNAV